MKDLTQVNGVKVEARSRARYTAENRPNAQVMIGAEIPTADELLLADGTVIYQCVHPKAEDCIYTNVNLRSVTAHQTAHGVRVERRAAADALARAEAAEAELAARKQRRSEGSKKGAETLRAKRAPIPTEVGGRSNREASENPTSSAIGDGQLANMAQRVITAYNAMQDSFEEFQKVLVGYIRAAQTATAEARRPAQVDPQILAKAQQYDVLQAALKAINSTK